MEELKGKTIKVFMTSATGMVCTTGKYLSETPDYLVIVDREGIEYISKNSIKTFRICGDETHEAN